MNRWTAANKEKSFRKPIFLQWRAAWIWRDCEDFLRALWPVRMHLTHSSILFGALRWRNSVHVSAELKFGGQKRQRHRKTEEEDREKKIKEKLHGDDNERAHYLNAPYCLMGDSFHFIVWIWYIVDVSGARERLCLCHLITTFGCKFSIFDFSIWFFAIRRCHFPKRCASAFGHGFGILNSD